MVTLKATLEGTRSLKTNTCMAKEPYKRLSWSSGQFKFCRVEASGQQGPSFRGHRVGFGIWGLAKIMGPFGGSVLYYIPYGLEYS